MPTKTKTKETPAPNWRVWQDTQNIEQDWMLSGTFSNWNADLMINFGPHHFLAELVLKFLQRCNSIANLLPDRWCKVCGEIADEPFYQDKLRLDYLEKKQYGIAFYNGAWWVGGQVTSFKNHRYAIDDVMRHDPL